MARAPETIEIFRGILVAYTLEEEDFMKEQHWILASVLVLFLCYAPVGHALDDDDDDEEDDSVATVIQRPQPKLRVRVPASTPTNSFRLSEVPKAPSPLERSTSSSFSFGAYLTEDISLARERITTGSTRLTRSATSQAADSTTGESATAETPTSGASGTSALLPLLQIRAGVDLSRSISLIALGSVNFQSGLLDPALGLAYQFPLGSDVSAVASLTGSVPVLVESREAGRLTTITGSAGPLWRKKQFFIGGSITVAGSLYGTATPPETLGTDRGAAFAAATQPTTPKSKLQVEPVATEATTDSAAPNFDGNELFRGGGELYAGWAFARQVSGNIAFSTTGIGRDNGADPQWITQASLVRITYEKGGLRASGAFNLVSDPDTVSVGVPSRPSVGFRLQYVFGSQASLGVNGTENVPVLR